MRTFHFDLGDSNNGPVGFCARIRGDTPEDALARLRELLPEAAEIFSEGREEYITVYFNPSVIGPDEGRDPEDTP